MNNFKNICEENFAIDRDKFIYLNSSQESLRLKSVATTINKFNLTNGIEYIDGSLVSIEKKIENVREKVADFFNCSNHDIVFTNNTTTSINIISNILKELIPVGSEIIVSDLDHVSNISPWKELSKTIKGHLNVVETDNDGKVSLDAIKKCVTGKTKVISLPHLSNTYSSVYDIESIIKFCKDNNIYTIVDGAQAVGKIDVDLKKLDSDFYVTSTHKMFSGSGGIIVGRKNIMSKGKPLFVGGQMNNGLYDDYEIENLNSPYMYEGGTKNISNILSISDSIDFLNKLDINEVTKYLIDLKRYAQNKLESIEGLKIINEGESVGNLLFNIEGHNHEDIRSYLDSEKIITRSGFSCSNNLNEKFSKEGFVRVSLHIYNNKEDIIRLYEALANGGDFIGHLF